MCRPRDQVEEQLPLWSKQENVEFVYRKCQTLYKKSLNLCYESRSDCSLTLNLTKGSFFFCDKVLHILVYYELMSTFERLIFQLTCIQGLLQLLAGHLWHVCFLLLPSIRWRGIPHCGSLAGCRWTSAGLMCWRKTVSFLHCLVVIASGGESRAWHCLLQSGSSFGLGWDLQAFCLVA